MIINQIGNLVGIGEEKLVENRVINENFLYYSKKIQFIFYTIC
jgi:hypothetical protein